jgi:hypothetical protein
MDAYASSKPIPGFTKKESGLRTNAKVAPSSADAMDSVQLPPSKQNKFDAFNAETAWKHSVSIPVSGILI